MSEKIFELLKVEAIVIRTLRGLRFYDFKTKIKKDKVILKSKYVRERVIFTIEEDKLVIRDQSVFDKSEITDGKDTTFNMEPECDLECYIFNHLEYFVNSAEREKVK